MLVRRVIGNEIENDPDIAGVRFVDQPVEVVERSEARIDSTEVGYVVTEILHRRGKERRDPDGVDAKIGQMVEPLQDAAQIADAIACRVLKRARINLVEDAAAPPLVGR